MTCNAVCTEKSRMKKKTIYDFVSLVSRTGQNIIYQDFSSIYNGLVKIRVGIYVAQLTKNELLNFSLFSQRLFSPKSLGLEFHNDFKIFQTIFLLQHVHYPHV